MDKNIIKIINYSKEYDGVTILNNITLELEAGNCYGFIGRNGSGKSILFKAIAGFIKPTKGRVIIKNKIIGKDIDFPEETGVLIEKPGFLSKYSGYENLKFLASINKKIGNEKIIKLMEYLDLNPNNKIPIEKYSLGMKQKVGIIQAIMENQEIIILDEPMNGLDNKSVVKVRDKLLELKNKGKTILLSSHLIDDINKLCDVVYEIDNGKIIRL